MKLALLLIALLAPAAFAQRPIDCDLTDAKTFYVMHARDASDSEEQKIDKALRRSGGLKQVDQLGQGDIVIDFTEPNWLNVWRGSQVERSRVGRWSLVEGSASMTLSGSIHTTTIHSRNISTSTTTVTLPRRVSINVSPEINTGSQFLFLLKVRRQQCSHRQY